MLFCDCDLYCLCIEQLVSLVSLMYARTVEIRRVLVTAWDLCFAGALMRIFAPDAVHPVYAKITGLMLSIRTVAHDKVPRALEGRRRFALRG